jgi:hypothetical protein
LEKVRKEVRWVFSCWRDFNFKKNTKHEEAKKKEEELKRKATQERDEECVKRQKAEELTQKQVCLLYGFF